MLQKIVSGGQTGVDRAALDAAIALNFPHGGWCPKGRLAEDGSISQRYQLTETESSDYSVRTELNVQHADGTLIIATNLPLTTTDGTPLTLQLAKHLKKPYLLIGLDNMPSIDSILDWIETQQIEILNIAGPRESQSPGIYQESSAIIRTFLQQYVTNHTQQKVNKEQSP